MKNIRYIDKKDVENLIENKTSDDVIIFLSGPTSQKTPLSVLRTKDIIAVNGSVQYLLSHNIVPFIYVLTDVRFLHQRRDDFYKFSQRSRYTIVNVDVYEHASKEDKLYILQNCLVLRSFYRREKGGFIKKIKFNILSQIHKELLNNPMPSELSKDLFKILPFFRFMRDNVEDINIYNLSDDTAISYDVIPFIKFQDISREESKDKTRKKMQYRTSTDSYAN